MSQKYNKRTKLTVKSSERTIHPEQCQATIDCLSRAMRALQVKGAPPKATHPSYKAYTILRSERDAITRVYGTWKANQAIDQQSLNLEPRQVYEQGSSLSNVLRERAAQRAANS